MSELEKQLDGAEAAALETSQLLGVLIDKIEAWITGMVAMLPNLIVALLVVLATGIIARYGSRLIEQGARRATDNRQVAALMATASKLSILTIGVFVALGLLNLDKTVTSLLAGVGVVGLALGFAFQDIAANFMSGVIMAVRRPFEIGDLVETHETMGTVERVTLRATVVRNFDGQLVIIPNKDVLQNPIVNYTQSGERRVEVPVGVSYDDDLEKARKAAIDAVSKLEGREESKPVEAVYTGFGGSSIDLSLRFWIDPNSRQISYLEARSKAIIAVKAAFDEAGIEIPFPIRTLDFGTSPLALVRDEKGDAAEDEDLESGDAASKG